MRLIDADALMRKLEPIIEAETQIYRRESWGFAVKCRNEVEEALTIDAVEIVRCKDCKHRPSGTGVNHDLEFPHDDYICPCRCEDFWYSWMPDDDWYCANGERREDGRSDKPGNGD